MKLSAQQTSGKQGHTERRRIIQEQTEYLNQELIRTDPQMSTKNIKMRKKIKLCFLLLPTVFADHTNGRDLSGTDKQFYKRSSDSPSKSVSQWKLGKANLRSSWWVDLTTVSLQRRIIERATATQSMQLPRMPLIPLTVTPDRIAILRCAIKDTNNNKDNSRPTDRTTM